MGLDTKLPAPLGKRTSLFLVPKRTRNWVAEKISPTYLGILFYYTKGPRPIPICQAAPFYYYFLHHNYPGPGTPANIAMFGVGISR